MRLGPLSLENRYVLAPMLNVSTAPYRRFCRKLQKIGLVSVPMLYAKKIEKYSSSIEKDLCKIEEERPISVQIIGSDPLALKKSIKYLESYNFDILDLNAGCPSKRAIRAHEGGYLMKDLDKLSLLLSIMNKYSSRPISLKIRTGFDKSINPKKLANIINDSEIDLLTVHARTVMSKFYDNKLDLETVKILKENLSMPVIGNGNISNPTSAKAFIDFTNVDAFMIGRESMGNPEIFSQIHDYLVNKKLILFRNDIETMEKYFGLFEQCVDEFLDGMSHPLGNNNVKFIELKRNAIWLSKNINKSTKLRITLSKAKNLDQLKEILYNYFNS
ncbi:MAG: tRNA dihydrouridine synthase [Promethearchaeota archaeon]